MYSRFSNEAFSNPPLRAKRTIRCERVPEVPSCAVAQGVPPLRGGTMSGHLRIPLQQLLMVRRGATDPLGHRGGLDAA